MLPLNFESIMRPWVTDVHNKHTEIPCPDVQLSTHNHNVIVVIRKVAIAIETHAYINHDYML